MRNKKWAVGAWLMLLLVVAQSALPDSEHTGQGRAKVVFGVG